MQFGVGAATDFPGKSAFLCFSFYFGLDIIIHAWSSCFGFLFSFLLKKLEKKTFT